MVHGCTIRGQLQQAVHRDRQIVGCSRRRGVREALLHQLPHALPLLLVAERLNVDACGLENLTARDELDAESPQSTTRSTQKR